MKKKPLGSIVILLMLTFLCFSFPAMGDVGNFNDYGGDYGSSYGGSDYSGGDYGSSYGGTYLYGSADSGDGGGGGLIVTVITVLVIIALAFLLSKRKKNRRGSSPSMPRSGSTIPYTVADNTAKILPAIKGVDPDFNEEKFIAWSKEVFITMQQAWMERDWSKIRPFEKEELFRQHEMQLQEYIKLGRINVIERININQAYLQKYERNADYETLDVYMQVRMVDYLKEEATDRVLKGNPNQDCQLRYLLTFMRKTGVLTDTAKSGQSTVACPHCGAPTQITSAGQCEYCGYVVTTGEFDWVLANIDGVKPQTVIDNRGIIINDDSKEEANTDSQE